MRLIVAVRCSMKPWRTRCSDKIACCSALLTGTKRMFGRAAASQIASASLPSFFELLRYGATKRAIMMPTRWPQDWNWRAHWCAPPHASMPIKHGGNAATSSISFSRRTVLRSTVCPIRSTPCTVNTDFARSIPTVVI